MRAQITTSKQDLQLIHRLPAGILPDDKRVELFADRKSRKVYFSYRGRTKHISQLKHPYKEELFLKIIKDEKAISDLGHMSLDEAIENFAFCMYGAADDDPDFSEDGKLQKSENFMCSDNCRCLDWASKMIDLNGSKITKKEIQVLMHFAKGIPDKAIADELGVKIPTINSHKQNLFAKFSVQSKTELVTAAIAAKIIQ